MAFSTFTSSTREPRYYVFTSARFQKNAVWCDANETLIGLDTKGFARQIDIVNGAVITFASDFIRPWSPLAINSQGDWFAACDPDGSVRLFRRTGGQWEVHGEPLGTNGRLALGIAFSERGEKVAASTASGETLIWDTQNGRLLSTLPSAGSNGWAVSFSPNDQWIGTADFKGTIRIWDADNYVSLQTSHQYGPVTALASSDNSKWLVTATGPTRRESRITVWRLPSLTKELTFDWDSPGLINQLWFGEAGKTLLARDHTGAVTVWHIGQLRRELEKLFPSD